jgi:hypothetical protein
VDSKIQYLSLEKLGFGTLQQEIPVYNGCALFVDSRMGFDADAGVWHDQLRRLLL